MRLQESERGRARARRAAHAAWDALLERIRATSGFADFLHPPRITELVDHARQGPVIFVSACDSRCDALILTGVPGAPVRVVELVDLSYEQAAQQVAAFVAASRMAGDPGLDPPARIAAQTTILDVLAWMWDTITEPVLARLGYTVTPADDAWPRVWWCPVGILTYLPLHAAGHHGDFTAGDPATAASPRTVTDRVISTYIPTLRGLAYARHHSPESSAGTLIVAVPDAPGVPPLPGVAAEAQELSALMPSARVITAPTRADVIEALPRHAIAHFACHGYANWDAPAASTLVLPDFGVAPLTVADIGALELTGSLAYLSACDTTVTAPALADEAIHITGAFHLAGVPERHRHPLAHHQHHGDADHAGRLPRDHPARHHRPGTSAGGRGSPRRHPPRPQSVSQDPDPMGRPPPHGHLTQPDPAAVDAAAGIVAASSDGRDVSVSVHPAFVWRVCGHLVTLVLATEVVSPACPAAGDHRRLVAFTAASRVPAPSPGSLAGNPPPAVGCPG